MTLPDERYRAVKWAEEFLLELSDAKKTPGIPKRIRQQAWSILRHYPNKIDMLQAADACPSVFQSAIEPVTRMIMQYQQEQKENNNDSTI